MFCRSFYFKGMCMKMNRKIAGDDNSAAGTDDSQIHSLPGAEASHWQRRVRTLLAGGGEMGERIRTFDWSKTPLGPIDTWSPALLTTVRILLVNRFPMFLMWGPEYISIYNDAYISVLGKKHPWALGHPVKEVWNEIWHILPAAVRHPLPRRPGNLGR